MSLFAPFRALGLVASPRGVPIVVKRRGAESWVTVACGDSFAVYDCRKLTLTFYGPRFGDVDVGCLATRKDWTFCGVGRDVEVVHRMRRCATLRGGHASAVRKAFVFGHHLTTMDADGEVKLWDVDDDSMRARDDFFVEGEKKKKEEEASSSSSSSSDEEDEDELGPRECELPTGFAATTVCHPDGYIDKLLYGSSDGRLALVNVRAGKLVHEFAGWGSGVAVLENSPAEDVVAVGLEDGRVLLVNLRDDQVLFTLEPDGDVRITALAFRTDDQDDILCVGDSSGRVTVWDLEKRSLRTLIQDCHDGPVVELSFLDGQPVMLSNGTDNTLKAWIFDRDDGDARLLRFRAGHSKPPKHVSFYGAGKKLLAAGDDRSLRCFNAFRDQQNIELSQKKVSKRAKRIGVAEEELKLPPVTAIAWGELRENDWANVVTAHEGSNKAYTWRLSKGVLGEHILQVPKDDSKAEVKSVAVSACGNFAFVGSANGAVNRFNLQSGAHRGALERVVDVDVAPRSKKKNGNEGYNFPGGKRSFWSLANQNASGSAANGKLNVSAHDGEVTCVQTHCANRCVVTTGVDGVIRVWKFNEMKIDIEIDVGSPIVCGSLHEDSLFAVGCADKHVRVYDIETGKRVRTFAPRVGSGEVKRVEMSSDARWTLVLDDQGSIRVYDIPAARLVQDLILGADKVVDMSFSPKREMLVTVHENRLGLYLWLNKTMYSTDPDVAYGRKVSVSMPKKHAQTSEGGDRGDTEAPPDDEETVIVHDRAPEEKAEEEELTVQELDKLFDEMARGPKQIEPGMITLAGIPQAQIETLLNLETVKEKNTPKEKNEKPEAAPFFLPTAAASDDVRRSVFDPSMEAEKNASNAAGDAGSEPKSRILRPGAELAGSSATQLISLIKKGERRNDYSQALEFLKDSSPTVVDAELRSIGPWDHKYMTREDVDNLKHAIKFFTVTIGAGLYYEMLNAQLSVFLNAHSLAIMESPELVKDCHALRMAVHKTWNRLDDLFNEVRCSLAFYGGATGV